MHRFCSFSVLSRRLCPPSITPITFFYKKISVFKKILISLYRQRGREGAPQIAEKDSAQLGVIIFIFFIKLGRLNFHKGKRNSTYIACRHARKHRARLHIRCGAIVLSVERAGQGSMNGRTEIRFPHLFYNRSALGN